MTINSLKDLQKLLKLLRLEGVKTFELNGIKLELNEQYIENKPKNRYVAESNLEDSLTNVHAGIPIPQPQIHPEIPNDFPTPEQLLMWSTGENQSDQQ